MSLHVGKSLCYILNLKYHSGLFEHELDDSTVVPFWETMDNFVDGT